MLCITFTLFGKPINKGFMNIKNEIKKLEKLKKNMPDLIIRNISIGTFKNIYIIVFQTLTSDNKVNDFVLKYFSNKDLFNNKTTIKKSIENYIPTINYKEINKSSEIMNYLLNGFTVVLSATLCAAFETKATIDRAIAESTSEPSIRGPKDSFNENYNMNIGLIRRRIKNDKLYIKEFVLGKETKTKVGVMYIDDISEHDMINEVCDKISKIKNDSILDSYYIKELIKKENKTLFPTISSKEKPDEICLALLKGKVAIIVENSPNVLIIPSFFIDFFHNSEDYYEKSFYSSFIRVIRMIAFVFAIFLPAFYIALTTIDQQILPTSLLINFASQRQGVPFPAVIEAFILTLTFELLYEGDARTPPSRGASISILGALVLGDAAVNAGLVSPIMVIIVSLSAISSLLFAFVDLHGAIRFWRYLSMILSSIFGIIGFIVSLALMLLNLCSIKSFGKPYLIPFVPFYKKEALNDSIFRKTLNKMSHKKRYLTKENEI